MLCVSSFGRRCWIDKQMIVSGCCPGMFFVSWHGYAGSRLCNAHLVLWPDGRKVLCE